MHGMGIEIELPAARETGDRRDGLPFHWVFAYAVQRALRN